MSAPPQATASPTPKRRKVAPETLLDIPPILNLQTGTRIQVKWTINDDEDEPENKENASSPSGSSADKKISVWWTATLQSKTEDVHTLTPEEKDEVDLQADGISPDSVQLPIYELDYDPLPQFGFDERAVEQVAFVSNKTLLNLSTEEIMIYKLEGEASPPPSPVASDTEDDVMESDGDVRHLTPDGISSLMDEIMSRSLQATGITSKLTTLPMDQQQAFAQKVRVAKEKLYSKLMREMDRISAGGGEKVISGDLVRRCLSEMGESTTEEAHQI